MPLATCKLCGTGPIPKVHLGGRSPNLLRYQLVDVREGQSADAPLIYLHDNCIVEYLEANPSFAIARDL